MMAREDLLESLGVAGVKAGWEDWNHPYTKHMPQAAGPAKEAHQ